MWLTLQNSHCILMLTDVLANDNPYYDIRVTTDASPYRVGCMLTHIVPNGTGPIAFASRTFSYREKTLANWAR